MIKLYLEAGLNDRLETVLGEYLTEDERYMFIGHGNIRRRIPHSRIVHIEDFISDDYENVELDLEPEKSVPSKEAVASKPAEKVSPPAKPSNKPFNLGELRKTFRDGRRNGQIPELPEESSSNEEISINVVVTGAEQRNFSILMLEGSFMPDQYSASLAKELSKDLEIKSMLDRGVVFDGPPSVINRNVYIKTKTLASQFSDITDKMALAGKLHEVGQKFMQPEKSYQTDFAMNMEDKVSAIPHSPFDAPILLEDITPISPDIVVMDELSISDDQGDLNESSSEEGGSSEEAIGVEASEGDSGILEEGTDT